MVWSEKKKEGEGEGEGEVVALGLLRRAAIAAMGCFFGCFRIKDSQSHLVSCPTTEPVATTGNRNALSSLFLSDDDSRQEAEKNRKLDNFQLEELEVRELKEEAKFLKACGTLPETPAEIRKASEKWKDASTKDAEATPLKFNSWLSNASIEKLNLEKQPDESPTPGKISEEQIMESGSLVETPSSCMTDGMNTRRAYTNSASSGSIQNVMTTPDVHANVPQSFTNSSVQPDDMAPSVQFKNKSVRFECESDISSFSSKDSSSDIASQNSKQSGCAGNYNKLKLSPYPTPLKLTDEMQTPGTVFPGYLDNMVDGKTARIRSQYVYSVVNPVENSSQCKVLKDEISDSHHLRESLQQVDDGTPISDMGMKELSARKDMKVEESLSSWLKPPSANQDDNNQRFGSVSGENIHCGRTPGDRPILGMVAAHWNDEENSRISPKWWDGNGIPNSTNKYKEDQKVSWHATPFEERLEKALSEETFVSQRKQISGTPPIEFNETEESDTALSQLQSSAHFKSVVSF
ncbi:Protein JASON [Forsythia ovata]|uniref:Protein JASON n=1 Tax=Forsythia ovata TaxID=205694 RepID=A0ABD1WDX5_9LAMI